MKRGAILIIHSFLIFLYISISYSEDTTNISEIIINASIVNETKINETIIPNTDLEIIRNLKDNIYLFVEYENIFKIKNQNYPNISNINLTLAYNLTYENLTVTEYRNITGLNSYKFSGTGELYFNQTGNYTICGLILNSTINDTNTSNDFICFNISPIDASSINCDISIKIISEDVLNESIKYEFELNNKSDFYSVFNINYYVTDLFDEIICEAKETNNENKKSCTKNFELQAYIIHTNITTVCNDTNPANNHAEKMIKFKKEEKKNQNSLISIETIYSGTDNKVKFGETFRVKIKIYKGNSTKTSIQAYVVDKNREKISDTTSLNLEEKFKENEITIPISVDSNCKGRKPNGEYTLFITGLDTNDSAIIKIEGIDTSSCETIKESCSCSKSDSTMSTTISAIVPTAITKDFEVFFPEHIYANNNFEIMVNITNKKNETKNFSINSYAYKGPKCYSESREANLMKITIFPFETNTILLENKILESGDFSFKTILLEEGKKTPKEITQSIFVEEEKNSAVIENITLEYVKENEIKIKLEISDGDFVIIESFEKTTNKTIGKKKKIIINLESKMHENIFYFSLYKNNKITDVKRFVVLDESKEDISKEKYLEQKYNNQKSMEKITDTEKTKTDENKNENNKMLTGNSVLYQSKNYRNKNIAVYFIVFLFFIIIIFLVLRKKDK
jgi:hypothetical protein